MANNNLKKTILKKTMFLVSIIFLIGIFFVSVVNIPNIFYSTFFFYLGTILSLLIFIFLEILIITKKVDLFPITSFVEFLCNNFMLFVCSLFFVFISLSLIDACIKFLFFKPILIILLTIIVIILIIIWIIQNIQKVIK